MIIRYLLKQEMGHDFIYTEIPYEQQESFCCEPMKQHIKHEDDFYFNEKEKRLEVCSYDHETMIIKYCFNCGQRIVFEYLGKQMMKRDEEGRLFVKVGDPILEE